MHTLTMIAVGLVALAILAAATYFMFGRDRLVAARVAMIFIPVWLIVAVGNLFVGVYRAGVPLSVEIPVLAAVFGVPAAAAWLTSKKLAAAL